MATIPYHVAESFMRYQPARSGAFVSVGDAIYSYSLKLAHWRDGKVVIDTDLFDPPSTTTARHMRALREVINGRSINQLEVRIE